MSGSHCPISSGPACHLAQVRNLAQSPHLTEVSAQQGRPAAGTSVHAGIVPTRTGSGARLPRESECIGHALTEGCTEQVDAILWVRLSRTLPAQSALLPISLE